MKSTVIVRLEVEGFHNFPKAPEIFPEVGFLADRHRHIFHIECEKEVFHDDRDVEFILFKREVKKYLLEKYSPGKEFIKTWAPCEFGPMSCEMIARELLEKFDLVSCSVFEDGENGAKFYK